MIKVSIVEDDSEIRNLLSLIIDGSPGFECTHTYSTCEDAITGIPKNPPDVVLMDIDLPKLNGIEGIRILKEKVAKTDFIMLTIKEDDESVFQSLCAGATGYLVKDIPPVKLLNAIKDVVEGGSPMSAGIARKVTSSFHKNTESPLSARETEVLKRLCDGENYKTIADAIFVSGNTVRAHIKNIYKKLQVNSRAEAVAKAINKNLL
ncbi:MAG: response regulator transcription factor [Ignavibacteriae bacterium]|nr:DNA-binding response regulator [Ignavibacteriota bacterium]NOG98939.1 response regulator transcription factor [Ignavibacteriota bacterium]